MLWVGLTGGIGSGKSSVAARLAGLGAEVLDADEVARGVVGAGTEGLAQVAGRFGPGVLGPDGELDRAALGRIVFADKGARADLEGITHPLIAARTRDWLDRRKAGAIAVHDVPLLVELGYAPRYHLVVVVGAPEKVRVERLVTARGMPEPDAWSRVRAQVRDGDRRAVADAWLQNDGTPHQLQAAVDDLFARRLSPYRDNLAAARPAPVTGTVAAVSGEDLSTRGDRVVARVAHVLGTDDLSGRHTGVRADPVQVQVALSDPDDPTSAARLSAGGFPATAPRRHASADPDRPATVVLVPPD